MGVLIQFFTRYFDDLTFYRGRIVACIISIFFSNVVGDRKWYFGRPFDYHGSVWGASRSFGDTHDLAETLNGLDDLA